MKQELRDSIVHTLATMVLDNADNERLQHRLRTAMREVLSNMPQICIHKTLVQCLSVVTNCDDADAINALIGAVRMAD